MVSTGSECHVIHLWYCAGWEGNNGEGNTNIWVPCKKGVLRTGHNSLDTVGRLAANMAAAGNNNNALNTNFVLIEAVSRNYSGYNKSKLMI